jgi:hypothetical protein
VLLGDRAVVVWVGRILRPWMRRVRRVRRMIGMIGVVRLVGLLRLVGTAAQGSSSSRGLGFVDVSLRGISG